MRSLCRLVILLAALVFAVCVPGDQSHHLALVGGAVSDGTGVEPYQGWTVLIHDSLIAAVGPEVEVPRGAFDALVLVLRQQCLEP